MYKKVVGLSILLLSGCSTLSSDDDFSDAIEDVIKKSNYVSIEAKNIQPIENQSVGANALKNTSQLVANYAITDVDIPSSYIAVELSYFRSSYEYQFVSIEGVKREITPYAMSTESCSEHCTATQYFSFPIDNSTIEKSAISGLTYHVETGNKTSELSFSIPAAYFKAVLNEKAIQLNTKSIQKPVPENQVVALESKPVEMTKYWFNEASQSEQEMFSQWAFVNRKKTTTSISPSSKAVEMLVYWYEKSSEEERASLLTWMINK